MRQLTVSEKKRLGKKIVDGRWKTCFRDIVFPLLMLLSRLKVKYKIIRVNDFTPIEKQPIIFVSNHSAFPDTPIALKVTRQQSYIFAGTQRLTPEDMLFFSLNGSIWVDRMDKADMQSAKEALLAILRNNRSILWFPEGTWNLTENLLMLPIKWGIVNIAQLSGAQIIPMALEYDRENMTCTVKFGLPYLPPDQEQGVKELRDILATLCWELWEQKGLFRRSDLNIEKCREELQVPIQEYPPLQWEKEQKVIFRPYEDPQEVFAFMEKLIPSRDNAFLLRK